MPTAWTYEHGCGTCDDDLLDLSGLSVSGRHKHSLANLRGVLWRMRLYVCVCFV